MDHWKTELLMAKLGAEGVCALFRLWGRAQIDRRWTGLNLTPKTLAIKTKWKANENLLWEVFTDSDAPWLDKEPAGTFAIHGFADHQKQVIHLWTAGCKGGRPRKKGSPAPPLKRRSTLTLFENQMVSTPPADGELFAPETLPETGTNGTKNQRPRDLIFDALATHAERSDPKGMTKTRLRTVGVARSAIAKATPDVTPDEIERRCRNYRTHFPDATLTAPALANHWGRCLNPASKNGSHRDPNMPAHI